MRALRLAHELAAAEREQAGTLGQLNHVLAASAESLARAAASAETQSSAATALAGQVGQVATGLDRLVPEGAPRRAAAAGGPSICRPISVPAGNT